MDPALLSSGEAVPGALGPVLGSSMQGRAGQTGESPAKGHGDERRAEHLSWERLGLLSLEQWGSGGAYPCLYIAAGCRGD